VGVATVTSKQAMVRRVLCAWLVGCATAAARSQEPMGPDVVLVHAFKIPSGESWGPVSIDLSAGGWRVGAAGGPPATEGHLRLVLRSLAAVEVGGRCTGWVNGATAYPCGFSLRDIDWAGAVEPRYAAIAVDQESVAATRKHVDTELSVDDGASAAARSPQLDGEHFVALRMPPAYLGDKSGTIGGTLRFELRALSNALVPSKFDRASGLVILRARLPGERS